jgi:hypothetical protein
MKLLSRLLTLAFVVSLMASCKKDQSLVFNSDEAISDATLAKIANLGFGTANVQRHPEGYLVENDIVLTEEMLNSQGDPKLLRIANDEQYRTTNLVKKLPRNITISVASTLPSRYITAADAMIARYNALGLQITFSRVSSGGNIVLSKSPKNASYLASSGFPTSTGNPYNSVIVNSTYLETNAWDINSVTSILAHEVGHCIGFRHTDYMSRQYSCGGSAVNEGASTVGAVLIPGTPSTPDANSFMLACIGKNVDRPFNANDIIALNYLY